MMLLLMTVNQRTNNILRSMWITFMTNNKKIILQSKEGEHLV